jgi:hypothetical protein
MERLKESHSNERYPEMKQMLLLAREQERGEARILSAEFNRKLYG